MRSVNLQERDWTGRDLAAERVRIGFRQRDVAAAMGVSEQRVGAIEATERPTPESARRYLTALGVTPEIRLGRAIKEVAAAIDELPSEPVE